MGGRASDGSGGVRAAGGSGLGRRGNGGGGWDCGV